MCLLAVLFRVVDDAPVVIGANREEQYARGGEPPAIREGPRPFISGIDPVAGGTWLGVNDAGVVVGLTNRPKLTPPKNPRSRGLLVRDLFAAGSAREARDRAIEELRTAEYAGFNLLFADADDAVVIHGGEWLRITPLPPGEHVLTKGDVNQPGDERVAEALGRLRSRRFANADEALEELRRLCSHAEPPVPVVVRGETHGTVSSTLMALREPLRRSELFHAAGSPDVSPYQDLSEMFGKLRSLSGGRA